MHESEFMDHCGADTLQAFSAFQNQEVVMVMTDVRMYARRPFFPSYNTVSRRLLLLVAPCARKKGYT